MVSVVLHPKYFYFKFYNACFYSKPQKSFLLVLEKLVGVVYFLFNFIRFFCIVYDRKGVRSTIYLFQFRIFLLIKYAQLFNGIFSRGKRKVSGIIEERWCCTVDVGGGAEGNRVIVQNLGSRFSIVWYNEIIYAPRTSRQSIATARIYIPCSDTFNL